MTEAAISSIEELVGSGKFAWEFSAAQASAWDLSPGDNPADLPNYPKRGVIDRLWPIKVAGNGFDGCFRRCPSVAVR
jgi:hypothetical protein